MEKASKLYESITDNLPDNYIPFILEYSDGKYEGSSPFIPQFKVSLEIPVDKYQTGLDEDSLIQYIKQNPPKGKLTMVDGRVSKIDYEIVNHKKDEEHVYMKTSQGYFVFERFGFEENTTIFVINWWYCPPTNANDIRILEFVYSLLADSRKWHKEDDRKCDSDEQNDIRSLFCALKRASLEITGEYNHHNTAIQYTRFVIDDLLPDHQYAHTLMDYNNEPKTRHEDILNVISVAKERIKKKLCSLEAL